MEADGTPTRIDKAYSWDAPIAAHGLMHMVITNAALGDPYPIDVLFLYMANMSWNSSMNIGATLGYLTAKNDDGSYKIPKIIYSDAYASEMVAYADLILPDTTYLERYDCISLLDRPISDADGPADAIRHPVVKPDRNVRGFQDVLIDLGARLKLPGFTKDDGTARYPGGYPDYIVNHERSPGIGPLAGWRGEDGKSFGVGKVNPKQLERIHRQRLVPHPSSGARPALDEARQQGLSRVRQGRRASSARPIRSSSSSIREPLQKFRLAARGHGAIQPPATPQAAHRAVLRSAAVLVSAVRRHDDRRPRVPDARDHAAADAHVPLVGLAERVAAPDHQRQPALHEPHARRRTRHRRRRLGLDLQPHRPRQGAGAS